jgi:tetratricopeptide (TPR) repeat protein
MKLLEGIQLHELVLIILGFILGLALIFILLIQALRGRMNLKLLWGFAAPLAMIGYPSLQGNEFEKQVSEVDQLVLAVKKNPTDTVAQRALIEGLGELPASRCKTSSDAMTSIANAQAALGMYDSAKVTIKKAADINPKNEKVQESQKDIQNLWQKQQDYETRVDKIRDQVKKYRSNPKVNRPLRDSIANNVRQLNESVHISQEDALVVADAALIIEEKEAAYELTEEVLKVNPKQEQAIKLQETIKKQSTTTSKPNTTTTKPESSKTNSMNTKVIPKVDAPVQIQLDTTLRWKSRLVPKGQVIQKIWNKAE